MPIPQDVQDALTNVQAADEALDEARTAKAGADTEAAAAAQRATEAAQVVTDKQSTRDGAFRDFLTVITSHFTD